MEALIAVAFLVGIALPVCEPPNNPSPADTLLKEEYVLGPLTGATRVLVNPQGWIYVADAEDHRVTCFFDPTSKPRTVGGFGWGATTFDRPSGLATDGLTLYVADYHNHRVQRFDRYLNYLSTFSTRDTNIASLRFGFPTGVALSRQGDLFVLEAENPRVLKFSSQLRFERTFGGIESERGRLQMPVKILTSHDDRVYVLEPHRIVEYDYFGNVLRTIGEGLFRDARGFDVGDQQLLVVSDDTLHWFTRDGRRTKTLPASAILASVPLVPLRDVVLLRDRLLVLTAHHLVMMSVHAVP